MLLGEALGDELKAIFEALHLPVELGNADAVIIGARLIPLAIAPRDDMTHQSQLDKTERCVLSPSLVA